MATPAAERSDLMSELGLDHQNKGSIGRLLASGKVGQAEEGADSAG